MKALESVRFIYLFILGKFQYDMLMMHESLAEVHLLTLFLGQRIMKGVKDLNDSKAAQSYKLYGKLLWQRLCMDF